MDFHRSNFFDDGERIAERDILTYGGELERLLYLALKYEKRVMITLKSGKVYIGRVTISVTPEDKYFSLLPIKSGYRDGSTQRLEITTHYDEAYQQIQDNEENYIDIISDFGVVIPISEIVSASLYREEVRARYFPPEEPVVETPELPSDID
jgi:hypothetical protein